MLIVIQTSDYYRYFRVWYWIQFLSWKLQVSWNMINQLELKSYWNQFLLKAWTRKTLEHRSRRECRWLFCVLRLEKTFSSTGCRLQKILSQNWHKILLISIGTFPGGSIKGAIGGNNQAAKSGPQRPSGSKPPNHILVINSWIGSEAIRFLKPP